MEAFSLLKYWKATTNTTTSAAPPHLSPSPTTTAVSESDDDDDGPFFDLEFAVPADEDDIEETDNENTDEVNQVQNQNEIEEEEEEEVEPNLTFSPSDDLFFKGRILQIHGSHTDDIIHSGDTKSPQFPIPLSLARSATKFRVFLLGLTRSNSKQCPPPHNHHHHHNNKKFFTVKFKVEEVPILSLLTRASSNSKVNSTAAEAVGNDVEEKEQKVESGGGEEKRNKKEVVQKYLKMVKPLYVKVSKRNQNQNQKTSVWEKREKMVGQGLNLKVIAKKHLGKSKSAVVHHNNNTISNSNNNNNTASSKKRDDSLLQQQDGIQSAILHCKRSFNSSKDFLEGEEASSMFLTQSVNESLNEKKKWAIMEEENERGREKGNVVN